ncbi:pRiA4b ORF-3-like protein [Geosporobacter subterraneus DSM 17957]|uniref:PRiA4b ORF-3-like protein n=1 Tax=Geosporobacter subterraneus DSM 17957 TaxID=1121919 RepID=A0A1M6QQA1_9FIRM|nr:plasmid pRiA4b ORF-3 family protein [Geosporobacter subterraneus]SHK22273.1 pRiA4b ORF-3-like protein [Geosporobacter subterraneus DSM 17957]
MQIALTKKLAEAVGVKAAFAQENENPLFSWTANWTKVWDNRRTEDMIVLVNNATRFTVAIYQVKKKDLKNLEVMMKKAISNTLLFMNINPEIVEEYMRLAGDVELVQNRGRQTAAWVSKAGLECSFYVGREYNGIEKMFCDTVGSLINYNHVNITKTRDEGFAPYQEMINALTELTGKPAYKYRAFELSATLNLDVYKAVRRIIVPANLSFERLHNVLQTVFNWKNYHLYDFAIHQGDKYDPAIRVVPNRECLEYDENAVLMEGHTLSEFLPEYKHILYTYDMGDNWEHEIELAQVIEDYDKESPFLVEAIGQTPPEDVGGVGGYVNFREIMLDPRNPEYKEMKEWARFWTPELSDWEKRPRVIRL